jgi:integrase/recombinase XerD
VKTTTINGQDLIHFLKMMRNHMKLCGYSPCTVKAYIGQTQSFIRLNRPIYLQDISQKDIQSHLNYLIESGLSRSTIDQATKAMEIFYYELFGRQLNLSELKRPRKARPSPIVLTHNEVNQIACHTKTNRNRLMIELAYSAGLRVSELVEVKVEHINLDRLMLHVPGLDKNKRITFFSQHLKNSLEKEIKTKNIGQYLFSSKRGGALTTRAVANFFKKSLIASGLKKLATPHSLRQSFSILRENHKANPAISNNTLNRKTTFSHSPDSKKAA